MIPSEVAEIRDILMKEFNLSENDAEAIAWSLYNKGYRKEAEE